MEVNSKKINNNTISSAEIDKFAKEKEAASMIKKDKIK